MTPHTIPQPVLFPDLFATPLVATFDQEHASSDGGAVLLKAAERVYGVVKAFARCLADQRAPGKIRHTLADLIGQRIFGIACGHADGNDADHLAGHCQVDEKHADRPPRYWALARREPTMLGIKNGRQPQLDCEHDYPACWGRSVTPMGAGGWWPDPQPD